jgi:hypothetical protein
MQERKLYGDAKLINELLKRMQLMEEAAGGWAAVYKDASTGKFWMKCYALAEAHGGGYELLIRLPLPATDELTTVAIESPFEDEAVAAVMRLLDEEALEGKDFRHLLVQQLEEMELESIKPGQKQRIRKLITLTSLLEPTNRRQIEGKTVEQLQADALYFEDVARKAMKLLDRL